MLGRGVGGGGERVFPDNTASSNRFALSELLSAVCVKAHWSLDEKVLHLSAENVCLCLSVSVRLSLLSVFFSVCPFLCAVSAVSFSEHERWHGRSYAKRAG